MANAPSFVLSPHPFRRGLPRALFTHRFHILQQISLLLTPLPQMLRGFLQENRKLRQQPGKDMSGQRSKKKLMRYFERMIIR